MMGSGSVDPMGGGGASDFTAFAPGGGMDVMGSLKKNSKCATQYVNNPTGGMMQGGGGIGGMLGSMVGGF